MHAFPFLKCEFNTEAGRQQAVPENDVTDSLRYVQQGQQSKELPSNSPVEMLLSWLKQAAKLE